jgi:hypothetical protein
MRGKKPANAIICACDTCDFWCHDVGPAVRHMNKYLGHWVEDVSTDAEGNIISPYFKWRKRIHQ